MSAHAAHSIISAAHNLWELRTARVTAPHVLAGAWMLLGWASFVITNNAGWVDVAWSTCLAALATFNIVSTWTNSGITSVSYERWLISLATIVWGVRIGLHVALRSVWRRPEEKRYVWLRQQWRDGANVLWPPWLPIASERARFLLFYLGQGALNSLERQQKR